MDKFSFDVLKTQGKVRPILRMGDPILNKVSDDIDPQSSQALEIAQDLAATIDDIGLVSGLAAPQIGISKRALFFNVPKHRVDEHTLSPIPLTILFNVTWKPLGDKKEEALEGCFSIPDLMGLVNRYEMIEYTYQDLYGEWHTKIVSGFHARVIQHEVDHLDGILYPKHIKSLDKIGPKEHFNKAS